MDILNPDWAPTQKLDHYTKPDTHISKLNEVDQHKTILNTNSKKTDVSLFSVLSKKCRKTNCNFLKGK